ncbi:unnamed protein product [Lepeophtheirus salmonis]|uniref:(salmon louse) hypothetical protein n=1 Tax=Lepeophtheirus salmonis TaxID=72036 RepID=A0A7R8D6I8_LEPSM|nr:unnamed protein product [Lepeophtheirus salmonis]CAF3044150.1 unnamed protein product [Lepeophtheirus salmonis]
MVEKLSYLQNARNTTKEEVEVVEIVKAAESTTKLNKIDQCLEDERNGKYAKIMKTSEEQSEAILDINNYCAGGILLREYLPGKTCTNMKSRKNPKRGLESLEEEQKKITQFFITVREPLED